MTGRGSGGSWRRSLLRADREATDAGFTLVEFLVAMMLFGVLSTVLMSFLLGTAKAGRSITANDDVNAEARLAINRLTRELQQASVLYSASSPDGATSLTFGADFNGDGVIEPDAVDPEVLTYSYDAHAQQLTVSAIVGGASTTQPILAGHVTRFAFSYYSSLYQYATTPVHGVVDASSGTTWRQLDAYGSPVGNSDGVLDGPELRYIDSIGVDLTVAEGTASQSYSVRINLRNMGVGSTS